MKIETTNSRDAKILLEWLYQDGEIKKKGYIYPNSILWSTLPPNLSNFFKGWYDSWCFGDPDYTKDYILEELDALGFRELEFRDSELTEILRQDTEEFKKLKEKYESLFI